MKETKVYRSEFMVIHCPYCEHIHYLDIDDDMGGGNVPEQGRKMTCEKCKKTMLVVDY